MTYRFEDVVKVDDKTQMRDAVIGRLYELSEKNPNIVLCTADMGAKAMDKWREREDKLKDGRFNEFGIAEQAMADVAAGMAKEGLRPFIYAIANFVTARIQEFHELNAGVQNLPYVTLGVGTGYSYPDSGPTHYMLNDIPCMRSIPNIEILSPSDSVMAAKMAEEIAETKNPVYMRLERSVLPINFKLRDSLKEGFRKLGHNERDGVIISTGTMVPRALEVQEELLKYEKFFGVIDVYRLNPFNSKSLIKSIKGCERVVTLEEHYLTGGLGGMVAESFVDNNFHPKVERIGVAQDSNPYMYKRENIHKQLGLDTKSLVERIKNL